MSFFSAEQVAHMAQSTVRVGMLFELFFKSSTERIWSGNTMLTAGARDWRPTYGMVQVDGLGMSGEPVSKQVTLSTSGVDENILPLVLAETEEADQQPMVVYLQFFDTDWQNTGALVPIFNGLMQPPRVSKGEILGVAGATQTISLSAENAFLERARPAYGRYTSSDQNKRAPTPDKFFDFVPSLFNRNFTYPDFVFVIAAGMSVLMASGWFGQGIV